MIRNPKAFEAWPTCSCNIHYVITELGMLPSERVRIDSDSILNDNFFILDGAKVGRKK